MANTITEKPIRVLLIEDSPGDARLLQEALRDPHSGLELEVSGRLSDGLSRLSQSDFDVVLLDLALPDSHDIDTVIRVREHAPGVPIVVVTGTDEEQLGIRSVQAGAQDYLVKGKIERQHLLQVIRYSIERHRMLEHLRDLSLTDELTGLYNRRGFLALAGQHLKLADRARQGCVLVLADLDGLKQINDRFGHPEGDLALRRLADAIRETTRESAIAARIGGDEFAIFMLNAPELSGQLLADRITRQLETAHRGDLPRYPLSVSMGAVSYDPERPCSIDELLARADRQLYAKKTVTPAGESADGSQEANDTDEGCASGPEVHWVDV
jgi:diguanylate cyclase (GGDEF)-like protein